MASKNDWKCERIFEDADDGLINFSYEFLTQAELPLVVPLSRFRHIRLCRQAVTHSACSPAKMRALASSQEEPTSGFRSYSSRRASTIAFSCSLSSPLSNHISLSSSFSLARISRRSSALSLGSASRISALIMAEIYRGQQGAASKRLGKKRYPFPAPPSSILTEPDSETRPIYSDASH